MAWKRLEAPSLVLHIAPRLLSFALDSNPLGWEGWLDLLTCQQARAHMLREPSMLACRVDDDPRSFQGSLLHFCFNHVRYFRTSICSDNRIDQQAKDVGFVQKVCNVGE
jgi:hypothetical protein